MRGAKSNALFLKEAKCNPARPCVALVIVYSPHGLRNYWMGHAGSDMSALCDKIKEDVAFRREWAERDWFWLRVALSCTECTETHRRG